MYALKKIACSEGVHVAMSLEDARREAKLLLSLPPHPNIIRCFAYSAEVSIVKLLLELCPGGHLLGYMDRKDGRLSPNEILRPFCQVTSAVCHLHSLNPPIQHRDLKAENVLQDQSGEWKLCDFGSCSTERLPATQIPRKRLWELQEEIDKTVTMLYRPPEMADISMNVQHGYEISEQVDLWMLGCILYTLAFYRHPFQDNASVMAISNAKYFIPQDHPMARSEKICGVIHWLLSANPKDRPSAPQLLDVMCGIGKLPFEELHAQMPPAVQEKIQRLRSLFKARGREPADAMDAQNGSVGSPDRRAQPKSTRTAVAPPRDSRPTSSDEAQPIAGGSSSARTPAPHDTVASGFDINFAMAPDASPVVERRRGRPATAPTTPAVPFAPTIQEDLLSFTSAEIPSHGIVTAPSPQDTDLLGTSTSQSCAGPPRNVSGPPVPASLQQDAFPSRTTPIPSTNAPTVDLMGFGNATSFPPVQTQTSVVPQNASGSFWSDFADFASPAPATPGFHTESSVGFADFGEFASPAPAPRAASSAARSPVSCRGEARPAASTTADLLDLL